MSKAHGHLQQARAALTAFDPQAAEESLRSFEDEIKTSGLTADAAALCQAELAEIRGLAEAERTASQPHKGSFEKFSNFRGASTPMTDPEIERQNKSPPWLRASFD